MNELITAIIQRLEEVASELILPVPTADNSPLDIPTVFGKPTVFDGYLPLKHYSNEGQPPEFPHIIVRASGGDSRPDQDTIRVKMIIGGFSEDVAGYRVVLNILECIQLNFQEFPILDKRYLYEDDLQWQLYDDQPYPYWIIEAFATWGVQKPQNIQESI
ncbi:Uncharacterised protein [Yersinia aldovae]|uniref:hypothetical protein n=1 Tax=Yersinia aldovae TaxID=29483 RepID=UPI0005E8BBE4|nr:hypothetical protein [Yersinia aldovae]CNK29441.1 Uncharacterised protein [Yersinia aldovae]